MLHYLVNAIDKEGLIFFSDCQWVVDSYGSGPTSCTGAAHVHADIWRKVHALNDGRKHQVRVEKVKAHATEADLAQGYPSWYKEGNAYADAGAKIGRTRHPRNQAEEKRIAKAFVLLQTLGRFLARISVENMKRADDVPPFKRDLRAKRSAVTK